MLAIGKEYHKFIRNLTQIDPMLHQIEMRMSPSGLMNRITTLDSYKKWHGTHGVSFLSIYGRPGSGATFLTSNIVRILDEESAEIDMCYLSFSFNKQDAWASSSETMVLSLVRQLLSKRPRLFRHTRRLCTWITERRCINLQTLWILLVSLLSNVVKERVVVAIRAIQECNSSHSDIIDRLMSLRDFPNLDIKVIITSERPDWAQRYSDHFHSISLEEEEIMGLEVKALVRRRVRRLLESRLAWRDLDEEITEKFWTPAPNYYLAMAKVQELETESSTILSTKAAVLDRLKGFPSSINSFFERTVDKIPKSSCWWLLEALCWVMYALRPLTSSELAVAVAFNQPESGINTDTSFQTLEDRIASDLPGDINRTAGYWVKVVSGRVEVANTALKVFIVNKYMEDESAIHTELLRKCLRYISWANTALGSDNRREEFGPSPTSGTQYDLLGYAALYWPDHFNMAGRVDSDVVDEVVSFLENSDHLKFWSGIMRQHRPHAFSPDSLTSPLKISAIFGLVQLLDRFLDRVDELSPEKRLAQIHESMNLAVEQGHVSISLKLYEKVQESSVPPQLHKAAKRGFVKLIEEFLSIDLIKASIDIQDGSGYTPLLYAAQCGHKGIVELLLSNGANPGLAAMDGTESTTLHLASRIGQVDIARVLIEHGANPKARDSSGYNPLELAAEGGFDDLVRLLVPYYKEETEEGNNRTQTPLHCAAMYGHASTCAYLIEQGAKLSALNKENETPLYLAVRGGFQEAVQKLLEADSISSSTCQPETDGGQESDAFPFTYGTFTIEDEKSLRSKPPLQIAAQMGYAEIIPLLLKYECFTTSYDRNESLSQAAVAGHWEVLDLLLKKTTTQNPVDSEGNTALHLASKNGHAKLVSELLNSGKFDGGYFTKEGMTAIHLAAQEGHVRVVTTFINNGVVVDCTTSDGDKPIHFASKNGHLSVVKALQAVKDTSAELDHESNTPLILAAMGGHASVVKELLSTAERREEADPSVIWKNSYPLHMAISNTHQELARVLIGQGFPVDSRNSEGQAPIHIAASHNLVPMIELLIKCGADMAATNNKHETALCLAVQTGGVEACKAILESSPNKTGDFINIGDENADTPLYLACQQGETEIIRLLLEKKADPNQKCFDGWTPLHTAAVRGRADVVDSLLKAGADHNIRNNYESTPIILAAGNGSDDVVRLLLSKGADPKVINSTGSSALHRAAQNGHIECAKLLVIAGANYNLQKKSGVTPLHCATAGSYSDVVEYLIQKGADINARSHSAGSALELAMSIGNLDTAKILLDAHATMTVDETQLSSWHKKTLLSFALEHPNAFTITSARAALQHAISSGNEEAALVLISNGMDLNEKGGLYCTALQAAAWTGSLEILEKLLARGAEPDIVGGKFGTALNAAISRRNLEAVELLLNKGANPNVEGDGDTPVHLAVQLGLPKIVKALLDHKADPTLKDKNGYSLLPYAMHWNRGSVVDYLLTRSDLPIHDKDLCGRTPLMTAVMRGELHVVKKLLKMGANPDVSDSEEKTPLIRAVVARSFDQGMVETLLQYNADPALKDCRGRGPLYWACLKGKGDLAVDVIISALRAKADRSFRGQLAFHAATTLSPDSSTRQPRNILNVLLLTAANPDLTEKDDNGWTALYTATRYGLADAEEMLAEAMILHGSPRVSPALLRPSEWHRRDKAPCLQVSEDGKSVSVESESGFPVLSVRPWFYLA
jgi:ankyrin repeat protein